MTVEIKASLSDHCAGLLPELQDRLGCDSRSELIELLILSQVYDRKIALTMLLTREPRGRRWPERRGEL